MIKLDFIMSKGEIIVLGLLKRYLYGHYLSMNKYLVRTMACHSKTTMFRVMALFCFETEKT